MIKKNRDVSDANQASNRILAGTNIEGEVHSNGDIRVDGSLKGTISISGKLVIGENGSVEGDIKCAYATVSGKLKGKIEVSELLSLQATAIVNGEVQTNKLSVEPGAEFSGSCNMGSVVRNMTSDERKGDRSGKSKEEASA